MHSRSGSFKHFPRVGVAKRQCRDSHRNGHVRRDHTVSSTNSDGIPANRCSDSFRFCDRGGLVGAVKHDGELVAAIADDQIARPRVLYQQLRHLSENLVAAGEQVLGVDLVKVVKIDGEHRQRIAAATSITIRASAGKSLGTVVWPTGDRSISQRGSRSSAPR